MEYTVECVIKFRVAILTKSATSLNVFLNFILSVRLGVREC